MATKIVYDLVQASDIDRAFEIEKEGFPQDEAASLESLQSVFLTSETPIRENYCLLTPPRSQVPPTPCRRLLPRRV